MISPWDGIFPARNQECTRTHRCQAQQTQEFTPFSDPEVADDDSLWGLGVDQKSSAHNGNISEPRLQ